MPAIMISRQTRTEDYDQPELYYLVLDTCSAGIKKAGVLVSHMVFS